MNLIRKAWTCWALAIPSVLSLPSQAAGLAGHKTISLVTPAGDKVVIGHVDFSSKEAGYAFKLSFKRGAFKEIYMQETNFLCLITPGKEVCHFPYPPGDYKPDDSSGFISESDLRGLEYALLFVEKRPAPAEVDLNPFNGLYYPLNIVAGHIEGTPFAVDLKRAIIAGADSKYPIGKGDLDPLDAASQRFPRLLIE